MCKRKERWETALSQSVAIIVMAVGSLAALWALVHALGRARIAGDLDASTALTLAMGLAISLPVVIVVTTGGLVRRPDTFGDLVAIYPGWYERALSGTLLLAGLLSVVLVLQSLRADRPVHAAAVIALCLWALAQLSSGIHGGALLTPRSVVLLLCLLAAAGLPRGRGACVGAGIFGVSLALVSGALAVFRPGAAFIVPCEGACSGLGFTGAVPNPNLLGMVLAVSIPFAYLGFRGRSRLVLVAFLAGMAIATGSRNSGGTVLIMVVALLLVRPSLERRIPSGRAAAAGVVLAGAVLVSAYFPLHDWDRSALTDRPYLWSIASEQITKSPWLGYGPHKWATLYEASEIPRAAQRSAHNQWLDVLIVAGWIGAALLVVLGVAALWTAGPARPAVAVALATILLVGTTEGAWSIGAFDLLSFSFVTLLLIGPREAPTAVGVERSPARGAPAGSLAAIKPR